MTRAQMKMLAVTAGLFGLSPLVAWPIAGFQFAMILAETYALTAAIVLLFMLWTAWFESLGRKP